MTKLVHCGDGDVYIEDVHTLTGLDIEGMAAGMLPNHADGSELTDDEVSLVAERLCARIDSERLENLVNDAVFDLLQRTTTAVIEEMAASS